ncbi:hypothetical protein SISNIDRAFT_493443 [Sistotremastrum niveocremeum HHB9708]|uniref:Uncharacterized protein n=1 Tax=Sistotremastrum niveocremeum HHB9708 TaxID=1314777 RepID=A0A164YV18_9AGAM|nr:hypothetical protein SISNIDRAFT_493443 [Sistotremastrum niveocremeum HHB9708]
MAFEPQMQFDINTVSWPVHSIPSTSTSTGLSRRRMPRTAVEQDYFSTIKSSARRSDAPPSAGYPTYLPPPPPHSQSQSRSRSSRDDRSRSRQREFDPDEDVDLFERAHRDNIPSFPPSSYSHSHPHHPPPPPQLSQGPPSISIFEPYPVPPQAQPVTGLGLDLFGDRPSHTAPLSAPSSRHPKERSRDRERSREKDPQAHSPNHEDIRKQCYCLISPDLPPGGYIEKGWPAGLTPPAPTPLYHPQHSRSSRSPGHSPNRSGVVRGGVDSGSDSESDSDSGSDRDGPLPPYSGPITPNTSNPYPHPYPHHAPHPPPSSSFISVPPSSLGLPPSGSSSTGRPLEPTRIGYWNRRGDTISPTGAFLPATPKRLWPEDLKAYPEYGLMNEVGNVVLPVGGRERVQLWREMSRFNQIISARAYEYWHMNVITEIDAGDCGNLKLRKLFADFAPVGPGALFNASASASELILVFVVSRSGCAHSMASMVSINGVLNYGTTDGWADGWMDGRYLTGRADEVGRLMGVESRAMKAQSLVAWTQNSESKIVLWMRTPHSAGSEISHAKASFEAALLVYYRYRVRVGMAVQILRWLVDDGPPRGIRVSVRGDVAETQIVWYRSRELDLEEGLLNGDTRTMEVISTIVRRLARFNERLSDARTWRDPSFLGKNEAEPGAPGLMGKLDR